MALIEKRTRASGKPSYRVRVKFRGRVLSSTHSDRTRAERWAAEIGAKIRDDAHFAGEGNRRRALADMIDRYAEHVLPDKRNARSQRRHLVWWRANIGHLPLANVTRAVIAQCRDDLLKPHKGKLRGPATVVRYMASLSHVFTVAIGDWEWAEVNPVRGVRKPREPRGRDRYLQDEEREALLAACKASTSTDLYAAVLVALCTGMRRGEVLGLEWRDIDFPRRQVTLRQTKNGSRRSVPLVSLAYEVLDARSKVRRLDTPLIFPGRKDPRTPNEVIRPKDLTKPWETARRRAGLADFRFHDLRHSAASYLAMSGASTLEIAAILGHKTLQMTKRYSHLSTEHLRSVLERSNEGVRRHA